MDWLSAVAEAQQGDPTAVLTLATLHPERVRVDRVRDIATLYSCNGSGAVALQESITATDTEL